MKFIESIKKLYDHEGGLKDFADDVLGCAFLIVGFAAADFLIYILF